MTDGVGARPGHRVWLITGASSGFGRSIADAALLAGDRVVVGARRPEALGDLSAHERAHAVRLNVTDPEQREAAVAETIDRFGRIDVLVNNAGRTQVGSVEETTDAELRDLFEVHFFAPAALTRAVLPHMRRQGSGAIVQMSSMGGRLSFPGVGAYSATKFALEGASEALAQEVAPFGIKVLIVEPGQFRTQLAGNAMRHMPILGVYEEAIGGTREFAKNMHQTQPGDPRKAAAAIEQAIAAPNTPLRLQLGGDSVDAVRAHAEALLAELTAWEPVARGTNFDAS
jgi:NAD(P)-dependent dehydrogenase (short-subunit alcohol dehydrogenase family)